MDRSAEVVDGRSLRPDAAESTGGAEDEGAEYLAPPAAVPARPEEPERGAKRAERAKGLDRRHLLEIRMVRQRGKREFRGGGDGAEAAGQLRRCAVHGGGRVARGGGGGEPRGCSRSSRAGDGRPKIGPDPEKGEGNEERLGENGGGW